MINVTLFTESEFTRTGNADANFGTDYAWSSHRLVLSGAVRGGETYGTFPNHQLGRPDDAGDRGNWIPTTSLDLYAATWVAGSMSRTRNGGQCSEPGQIHATSARISLKGAGQVQSSQGLPPDLCPTR